MKSKNLILQVSHTRSLLRITGLTTGDTRSDLVHSCKYQEYKEMCRLPDIHRETATRQKKKSSRNNKFSTPRNKPTPTKSEGDSPSPSDSFRAGNAGYIKHLKQCVTVMRTLFILSTRAWFKEIIFSLPGSTSLRRGVVIPIVIRRRHLGFQPRQTSMYYSYVPIF